MWMLTVRIRRDRGPICSWLRSHLASCHYLLGSALVPRIPPRGGDLQSQRPAAGRLHDIVDVLRLEVVLKERILEVSMDLGNPDIVPSFRLQLLELEGTVR